MKIKGVKEIIIMFFSYCAIEQTIALWASSYFVFSRGVDAKVAASYGGLFFIGITIGRALSGFIAMKLNDNKLIRLGEILIIIGISLLFVSNKTINTHTSPLCILQVLFYHLSLLHAFSYFQVF